MRVPALLRRWLGPLLVLAPAAAQSVWIVDGGASHFTTTQQAAAAASDGDVILLRYTTFGTHPWSFVLNKGVTIVGGDGTLRAEVDGHLIVDGLRADQRVVLRSLGRDPASQFFPIVQVTVRNCVGSVVLDDVGLDMRTRQRRFRTAMRCGWSTRRTSLCIDRGCSAARRCGWIDAP